MDAPDNELGLPGLPQGLWRVADGSDSLPDDLVTDAVSKLADEDLRALHAELARQGAAEPGASHQQRGVLDVVRGELVRRRIEREAHEVRSRIGGEPDKEEPARRRILATLRTGPATGTDLASLLGLARETVTRILSALAADGYVTSSVDPDDRRRKIFRLEPPGLELLVRSESALGVAAPAAAVAAGIEAEYLLSSARRAVELRRYRYDLSRAEERLRGVVRRAAEVGLHDIEVFARRELISTLRHSAKWADAVEHIDKLETLATTGGISGSCVAPALAHVDYEQGRLPSSHGDTLPVRARKLTSAISDFDRLARTPSGEVDDWHLRGAWAMVGLAEVLREQTEFGKAIFQAREAQKVFVERGDTYGRTRTLFLQGFCDRLRGLYQRALAPLQEALDLSVENGYERWQAHAHMQLGDVSRCLEDHEAAERHLFQALALTESMPMPLTRAFAISALGATRYATKDFEIALQKFGEADGLFKDCRHMEGLALNTRRQAVALRAANDPTAALRLSFAAYRSYRTVQSPAGITASLVEIIEDLMVNGDSIDEAVSTLGRYMVRPSPRRLIELDPSAPQLLVDLFRRLEDENLLRKEDRALTEEAARLLHSAKAVLAENHNRESDILDSFDEPPLPEDIKAPVAPTHASVKWTLMDDEPQLTEIFDRQNVMGVEPRREAEREVAA